jgi:hypothetical protein
MLIEEIGADELRRMVEKGQVNDVVAVGLPGAWAVNILSDECAQDAMTLRPQSPSDQLHARYWSSLDELDHFLQAVGVTSYSVDRRFYSKELPRQARDGSYFPSGPEEFLDHEFIAYLRGIFGVKH